MQSQAVPGPVHEVEQADERASTAADNNNTAEDTVRNRSATASHAPNAPQYSEAGTRTNETNAGQEHPALSSRPPSSISRMGFRISGSQADFAQNPNQSGSITSKFALPLSWRKLSYRVGKKVILMRLTGTALPSRCLAIMGASGAGKTTFLNAISDRLATGGHLKLTGRRQLGDMEYQRHYRKALGFVTQDDIMSSLATPVDALAFSIRTRRGTSLAVTRERVQETLEILRLVHCKDTMVGIPGLVAGLSGGERKRCSIGVELICDPKILLLDEPTSGLDSVTSAKITNLLQHLARVGRTVIYTIHQPTAEVLSYFDDLMLLTKGRCVYHGTMANSIEYFESLGFTCPDTYTPSDYYMTLLQDEVTSLILVKRWHKFLKYGKRTPHTVGIRLAPSHSESSAAQFLDKYMKSFNSSFIIQVTELTKRRAMEISRDKLYISSVVVQGLFFALVVGLIFVHVRDNVEGMMDRQGVIFMMVSNRGMSPAFLMISSFHKIRATYIREQQAGAYSPLLFYIGRSIAEFPLNIVMILIESFILYFMVGLHSSPGAFFHYFGVVSVVSEVATGFGFAISATFPSLIVTAIITPLVLVPLSIAGGLFSSTDRLHPYWYWLEKPSWMRHGYILVMQKQMEYLHHVYCNNYKHGDFYCINQVKNGHDVLVNLGFVTDPANKGVYMWISMAILWFIVRVWCVIALMVAARDKA